MLLDCSEEIMLTRARVSNPRRFRDVAAGNISSLKKRIPTMEITVELTNADVQSLLRTSKLLGDVSNDFKEYHYAIVDQLENDEDTELEQDTIDQHELKVMELIVRIAELVGKTSQTKKVQLRLRIRETLTKSRLKVK